MKQAVECALKWLTEHSKCNPVPYKLFKSIRYKQIECAKSRRVNLDFGELSEAVMAKLLKAGVHTISLDEKQPEHSSASISATGEEPSSIPALPLSLSEDEPILPALFRQLYGVSDKATAAGITELRFSVNVVKESGHA